MCCLHLSISPHSLHSLERAIHGLCSCLNVSVAGCWSDLFSLLCCHCLTSFSIVWTSSSLSLYMRFFPPSSLCVVFIVVFVSCSTQSLFLTLACDILTSSLSLSLYLYLPLSHTHTEFCCRRPLVIDNGKVGIGRLAMLKEFSPPLHREI